MAGQVQTNFSQELPVAAGDLVSVDVPFGDIELEAEPGRSQVLITVEASIDSTLSPEVMRSYFPEISQIADGIQVAPQKPAPQRGIYSWSSNGTVLLKVPPGLRVDLRTEAGDITVRGELGSEVTASTGAGQITIETGFSGPVRLRAESQSGDIDIEVKSLSPASEIRAVTGAGDATLVLPAEAVLTGELIAEVGEVNSQFPGFPGESRFTLSGKEGASEVRVITEVGAANLLKGSPWPAAR